MSAIPRTMFVVSDLHLGGRPADATTGDPGFQICGARGQALLARWVAWCAEQIRPDARTEIVLAGDVVDFLSEEPFASFTADDAAATAKLQNALRNTAPVWDALRAFVAKGGELTILLGNHDLELSLPGPRRLLFDRLGRDTAPRFLVDFLDDDRARVEGPVLIEHGNRYDPWNAVPHEDLRRTRSALSRGEQSGVARDLDMPGSHLVTRVMNDIKRRYRFVDLLKPEQKGAIPILAALDPRKLSVLHEVAALAARAELRRRTGQDVHAAEPAHGNEIAAPPAAGWSRKKKAIHGEAESALDPDLALANELARERTSEASGGNEIGVREIAARLADLTEGQLHRALRRFAEAHHMELDVTREAPMYLDPARALARRFEVIVMGHTHLAKRVPIPGTGATYLNTGTWADLMRLPKGILEGADDAASRADLKLFADDLRTGDIAAHVRQIPTFARIEIGSGARASADVLVFRGDGSGAAPLPAPSLWALWDDHG